MLSGPNRAAKYDVFSPNRVDLRQKYSLPATSRPIMVSNLGCLDEEDDIEKEAMVS